MKRWLWPVNIGLAAALLLCTALPVASYESRTANCRTCDVHGYVFIFSIMIMLAIAMLALIVLSLVIARRKAGLVIGLLNAFLVGAFATGLSPGAPPWLLAIPGVLALSSLAACITGLIWAPRRTTVATRAQ